MQKPTETLETLLFLPFKEYRARLAKQFSGRELDSYCFQYLVSQLHSARAKQVFAGHNQVPHPLLTFFLLRFATMPMQSSLRGSNIEELCSELLQIARQTYAIAAVQMGNVKDDETLLTLLVQHQRDYQLFLSERVLSQRIWSSALALYHDFRFEAETRVEVRPSLVAGFGVFATRDCSPNEVLTVYPADFLSLRTATRGADGATKPL